MDRRTGSPPPPAGRAAAAWPPQPARLRRWLLRLLAGLLAMAIMAPATAGLPRPLDQAAPALTEYRLDAWQTERGLPMNTVQALLQTRDGALWVGTGGGLARFDGLRFTTFDVPSVPALATRPVFGFMEDRDGALWIGHAGGAARYRDGRFEPVFGNELTDRRRVWTFAQDPDGSVWAATENGLVHRTLDGRLRNYRVADGLPTQLIRSLAFDRDGTLWIGTSGGGLVRRHADGRFEVLQPANGFPHLEVRHVLADPAGGIWAATAGGGLVRVDGEGRIRSYGRADGLPTEQLTFLSRDPAGDLWIGTWGAGIVRYSQGRFTALSSDGGLGGEQIWTVHADREGGVWVGSWNGGLNRLSRRPFGVFGKPEGLLGDNVRSVLQARDGAMWLSMAGGGVNRLKDGRLEAWTTREGLPSDEVSALYEDRDGAIWIATYTAGLARLLGGRIERYGSAEGLPHTDVRVVYQDRGGTLWAGTRAGLARFDGRRFSAVREPGAPAEGVVSILQDRRGTLWFGTTGQGLLQWRDGRFTALTRQDGLLSNWIVALYEDADGSLWIGSNGEGLNRLRDGRIASITLRDGLWDGLIQTLLEDRHGRFWITGNRGFFRVERSELDAFAEGRTARVHAVGYGPGDALRTSTFAGGLQPAGARDGEGRLWLPSQKGVIVVDPERLPGTDQPPPVRIEEVLVDALAQPPDRTVEVPPGAVPVTLRYAAATLRFAERVRFRYRLDGVTPNWVDAGSTRAATFPSLPPGRHAFRVSASLDGRHWHDGEPLAIEVRPQPWQTWWFRGAAALLALAALVGLFQLRTLQLRRRHAQMERLVAEKTEALRQANEHLSRLSFSDALTGLANRRRLDEALDTEWRRALRTGTPLAVVLVDIDAFKAYNDTLGHAEGDRCLAEVAEVVRQAAGRAGDLAARYGGEEFVLLLPGMSLASAMEHAESLRRACEARAIPHPASPVAPVVTISLGVGAAVPEASGSPATLLAQADAALYRAKAAGRNRVG
ncbi:ligand-binding sensor domain-containing diguanylate cyclase [Piscinibacter sakaiensis]|uniref:diguanylate cyclase n=1 Tax=Piscinibacter sakaiensis TaxID=1547922 RepID=A0A0K8NVK3_PISS1|nr:two-component regulator propeller domain-containing protein [Piscinibacter sakaiensis]GAP34426.1 hypothetical protein ISF6_4601 [Piscinibacter sakaiensis]